MLYAQEERKQAKLALLESQQQRRLKEYNAIQEQQRRGSLNSKSQLDCPNSSPNHYDPKSNIDRGFIQTLFIICGNFYFDLFCLKKRSYFVSRLVSCLERNSRRGRQSMDRKDQRHRHHKIYCIRRRRLPSSLTRRPLLKDLPTSECLLGLLRKLLLYTAATAVAVASIW